MICLPEHIAARERRAETAIEAQPFGKMRSEKISRTCDGDGKGEGGGVGARARQGERGNSPHLSLAEGEGEGEGASRLTSPLPGGGHETTLMYPLSKPAQR